MFKNSLAALLSKGNPMMMPKKVIKERDEPIEEEHREKIKVDIFDDLDDENKSSPILDNVTYPL